jgi:neutral ceramidase
MRLSRIVLFASLFALTLSAQSDFQVGAGRADITPKEPVPMWGYGARHDALSTGVLDPLFAEVLVIRAGAGGKKLAIVGLDLGRAPAERSLQNIRKRLKDDLGIEHSIIAGSHTHHGPVLELSDEPGKGQGKFDASLRYCKQMEDGIVSAVKDADAHLVAARMGVGKTTLDGFNRNRHTKIEPKPSDRDLQVMRFDTVSGKPIAVLVNFTAHPTMINAAILKFSADYVGQMKAAVRKQMDCNVIFMQGASGDQSVNDGPPELGRKGYEAFGAALGGEVVKLAAGVQTAEPAKPSIDVREERFTFTSRVNFNDPMVIVAYQTGFFKELIPNFTDEYAQGVRPRLTLAILNGDIALVGVSGEFFANHAIRLKERARVRQLFFFGYANGYHQYFPTIEAVA